MEYKKAVEIIEKYEDYLIGEEIKDDEITHLVIVPANLQHNAEILDRICRNKPIDDIILKHQDFAILVVCDLDDINVPISLYKWDDPRIQKLIEQQPNRTK